MYRKDGSPLEKGEIHPSPSQQREEVEKGEVVVRGGGAGRKSTEQQSSELCLIRSKCGPAQCCSTLLEVFQSCRGGKPSELGAPS